MSKGEGRPPGLGVAGGRLWRQVADEFQLRPDERVLLGMACRTADTVAALEEALRDAPLTVKGSMGQEREHPLLSEARLQRQSLARLLAQLKLPDEDAVAEVRDRRRSVRMREVARARWS